MYSLNAPVPGRIARLASDLSPYLTPFDRVRDRHTPICKRLEDVDLGHLHERLRHTLAGQPAFEARVIDVRFFEELSRGATPVVYLAVDSLDLLNLHRTLTNDFGAIEGIEGNDYVPRVTLARGGSITNARAITNRPLDPIEWTVSQLDIYDSSFREAMASTSLPA